MADTSRERLDVLLVERGLAPSREKAQAFVMAGLVQVDGQPADKAGSKFQRQAVVTVAAPSQAFASRGGQKLEKALEVFGIVLDQRICLDIGASTGGFTDCMLHHGACRVYAVDVGYGQLAYSLRQDPRVVVRERVNARHLDASHVPELASFASLDVSFISLVKVLPAVLGRMLPSATLVALIKPQFEAGRPDIGKGGVVRSPAVHTRVLLDLGHAFCDLGLQMLGLTWSPVRGPAGNIEFLAYLARQAAPLPLSSEQVRCCVEEAHGTLSAG